MIATRLAGGAFVGLVAASLTAAPAAGNLTRGCVDRFDASADYFPDKARVDQATTFHVEYRSTYKIVTVDKPYPGGAAERYVLHQCGTPRPVLTADLTSTEVVDIPIRTLFSASTTHVPPLVDLGRLDVLAGVDKFASIVSPLVLDHIRSHHVVEFSPRSVVDTETVVMAKPDLFMTGGSANPAYASLRRAGVPVVANAEWLEPTALGRAEWIKYEALFLNEERRADAVFERVRADYATWRKKADVGDGDRPLIMTGRASRGIFTISGGRSYVATLIKDAGGRYAWADDTATGSTTVDLEAQLQRAATADFWINGGGWKDRAAMLADEPRYAQFKAFRTGQVWVYERLQNESGGNDYWTRSVTRPDLLLADLVKMFHPSLATDHAFEWYLQVAR